MKLTLDWNCVIEVEEMRPQSAHVIDLVDAHLRGEIEVALLATSASENSRSKRFPGSAKFFTERVSKLGWSELPLVPMPAVWGLTYWDFCFYIHDGEAFERDTDALWQVIAPKFPRKLANHVVDGQILDDELFQSEQLSKWRNVWCDVLSAYSHIHAKRDVFVTNNTRDFQRNAEALAKLGMEHICSPEAARDLLESKSA